MSNHEEPKSGSKLGPAAPPELTATPSGYRPWEDRSLPPEERFEAYKAHVREQVLALGRAAEKLGTEEELRQLKESPETQRLFAHAEQLGEMTAVEYCRWLDYPHDLRPILGKNLLGAEEWRALGMEVGEPPPIPLSVTEELLNSKCPLHPRKKIKDTHLLVLVPGTVNGEPFTALELDELCIMARRRVRHGEIAHDDGVFEWPWWDKPWAFAPHTESEWVLIPKSDPDPDKVPWEKHFRDKNRAGQQEVRANHYPEYREAKPLELMTAVLLYRLTHGRRLLRDFTLRCYEPTDPVNYIHVGPWDCQGPPGEGGLIVDTDARRAWDMEGEEQDENEGYLGLALAREL